MPSGLRRYDEPGHAHFWTLSCYRRLAFFWHDDLKQVVIDALRMLRQRFGICLIAYVVMPDHLHVVLYPHPRGNSQPVRISTLLHAFKKHVGFHGKAKLRSLWRRRGELWSAPLNDWAVGRLEKRIILVPRGFDFNTFKPETLIEKVDYCHRNPLTRGLVEHAEDWPWSNYRYYELDDASVLAMDWDGSWPIEW
jgi:putative transposase